VEPASKLFQIRGFRQADTAPLLALSLRAWQPVFEKLQPAVAEYVYTAFYPKGWEARQLADIAVFLESEGHNVYVATERDSILGWIGMRLHAQDNMGEIYILATDPAHQRKGVAAALMDHAMAHMRHAGMAIVMVETGDDPGHAASRLSYERAGFERWPVARYFKKLS
jgi:ribosomal protein S18 acetylase RimI-like enzyme